MFKINWRVRFKNKTFVITFVTALIAFLYQLLGIFEVVPPVTQDNVMQLVMLIINILTGLGILVDPTTSGDVTGISDSQRALSYTDQGK